MFPFSRAQSHSFLRKGRPLDPSPLEVEKRPSFFLIAFFSKRSRFSLNSSFFRSKTLPCFSFCRSLNNFFSFFFFQLPPSQCRHAVLLTLAATLPVSLRPLKKFEGPRPPSSGLSRSAFLSCFGLCPTTTPPYASVVVVFFSSLFFSDLEVFVPSLYFLPLPVGAATPSTPC